MGRRLARILPVLVAGIAGLTVAVALNLSGARVHAQTAVGTVPEWQKTAGGKMSFAVASVRPSDERDLGAFPLSSDNAYRPTGGLFRASFPLRVYIEFAYKLFVTPEQREDWLSRAPKWVRTDNYAIQAKAPIDNPTKDQFRLMIQTLLAERFNLKLHFENQQTPVLALTLIKRGKLGQRIRAHSEGPPCPTKTDDSALLGIAPDEDEWPRFCAAVGFTPAGMPSPQGANVVQKASGHDHMAGGRDVSIETMIGNFNNLSNLGRPIIDRTGLTGTFDFTLEWSPSPGDPLAKLVPANSEFVGITFPEAVKEQLGMKLESTKAAVPTLIVDHVERPSEN